VNIGACAGLAGCRRIGSSGIGRFLPRMKCDEPSAIVSLPFS
jgi:hypothetical protein